MSQGGNQLTPEPSHTNVGKATGKAGAYGGSELGSRLGGAVGPPIIGGIIGNLVGEKVGEKAIHKTGIDEKVTEAGDKLAGVIGKRNVDKLGDVAMSSFGYSDSETCICCPCLTASQVLLFITVPFFGFNLYKLGLGVDYDSNCDSDFNVSQVNSSGISFNSSYPCVVGYDYLVTSSAVWLFFLPFWILALFGTCWRQCCCCCCDPIVLCGTLTDLIKRYCCECGKFNFCELIWYSHCTFHLIWASLALSWMIGVRRPLDDDNEYFKETNIPENVWDTVLASIILDYILAGSEIIHRIKLHKERNKKTDDVEQIEMTEQGLIDRTSNQNQKNDQCKYQGEL